MARSVSIFLLLVFAATPAFGQSVGHRDEWRIREVTIPSDDTQLQLIGVGPNGRFGPGIFGLKSQTPRSRAVIGTEVSAPKQRRAGVGFSLKF